MATSTAAEGMQVHPWEWAALAVIIIVMILFDLFGHVRKPHEPTIKEAAIWTTVYIAIALLFGVLMYFRHSPQFATEYFAGYITEKALSLDNIFVFIIVIAAFKIPRKYQQKVLMYGIVIALVLRLLFILLGAAIIERFVWAFFFFGVWMIWTAYTQIRDGVKEDRERRNPELETEEEYKPNLVTRLVSKYANVTNDFYGDRLVVKKQGKNWITPMFLCIVSIGTVDLMFALDSVPAIYGLTKEPFIVFSANAFSLLGLRQLFFLVDGLLERLIYLHYGLAIILAFIGYKLLIHAFHGYDLLLNIPEPTIVFSVLFIVGTIVVTVIASIIGAKYYESKGIDISNKDNKKLSANQVVDHGWDGADSEADSDSSVDAESASNGQAGDPLAEKSGVTASDSTSRSSSEGGENTSGNAFFDK